MKKSLAIKRLLSLTVMLVVLMAGVTIVANSGFEKKVVSVTDAALTLTPNEVSSALNLSLSHLSYTVQPPQFMVNNLTYAQNATYSNAKSTSGVWAVNATYQIFQHNATSTAPTTGSSLSYYMKGDTAKATQYFTDSKIGFNGTGASSMVQIIFGADAYTALVTPAAMPKGAAGETAANISIAESVGIDINATASGSSYTYNASMFYYYLTSTGYVVNWTKFSIGPNGLAGTGSNPQALQALNMYELQVNMQATQQQVSLVYTNNGTSAQYTPILTNTNSTKTPYLNFTKMDNVSYIMNPGKASGGFLFDWMYLVDQNVNKYTTDVMTAGDAVISPFALTSSVTPTVATPSQAYGPNATKVAPSLAVNNNLFTGLQNTTNPSVQNAIGLNNSLQVTNYNSQFSGNNMVATNALSNTTNTTVKVNTVVSTWTTTGIQSVLVSYLKAYAASQAEKTLNAYVSPNDITIISYRIGTEILDTQFTASEASTIRNYLDNGYAAILASDNLSVVNPTTTAIVAGAYAGQFDVAGVGPVHAMVVGNNVIDPSNGHLMTLAEAGFSSGAYITSGAVIVPQFGIAGWSQGEPLWILPAGVTSGSFFSSLFGGLTSAGSAIANLAGSAASTITNGIGTVAKVVDNNVIKPVSGVVGPVASDTSNLFNSAFGSTGVIGKDIQGAFSNGFAGLSSSVNSIKGTLSNMGADLGSSIMSGYNGIKPGISSIGASVQSGLANVGNGLNGVKNALVNTAGQITSTVNGALSTVYTKMSNFVAGATSNVYDAIKGAANASYATLSSIGSTLTKTAAGYYTQATSALGAIGNKIMNGVNSAVSAITGALPGILHIVEIVVIAAIAIVGVILLGIFLIRRRASHLPGEVGL